MSLINYQYKSSNNWQCQYTVYSLVIDQGASPNYSLGEKQLNGKNPVKPILQFTVTPPRQSGPSEAERKIEALTQQLEEEFEKEEESEYFGKP